MLDRDGQPWVVDFGFAKTSAPGRALARDVAELLASQATKVAPERAMGAALGALGPGRLREALPYLTPAGLAGATRQSLQELPGRLEQLRAVLATSLGVPVPAPVRLARINRRVLAFVVAAGVVGYGLTVALAHGQLSPILADARWGFLMPAALAYAATFAGAALMLRGTSGLQLSLGRTLMVTLASSYSNRGAWARRGGEQLDIGYLEVNGLAPEEAQDALSAGSLAGAIVHLLLLTVVGPSTCRRTRRRRCRGPRE
jgi:glycosyltransferase 2 family protein